MRGEFAEAAAFRERALRIGEASLAECDPALVGLEIGLANSLHHEGRYAENTRDLSTGNGKNGELLRHFSECRTRGCVCHSCVNQGDVARDIGDLREANRLYERAAQTWSKAFGPAHPFVARGLDAVADVALQRGLLAQARRLSTNACWSIDGGVLAPLTPTSPGR